MINSPLCDRLKSMNRKENKIEDVNVLESGSVDERLRERGEGEKISR